MYASLLQPLSTAVAAHPVPPAILFHASDPESSSTLAHHPIYYHHMMPTSSVSTLLTNTQGLEGVVGGGVGGAAAGTEIQALQSVPEDAVLEEFKSNVRAWMDIDNTIKRMDSAIKERKKARAELTNSILKFMSAYNVEDLNTRDGRLRYKVTSVLTPLGQKKMKERLSYFLETKFGGADIVEEAKQAIFSRERTEKVSLRRMKTLV